MTAEFKCSSCGTNLPKNRYFCPKCGKPYQNQPEFEQIYLMPSLKLSRICQNLKFVPHKSVPWDATIDAYVGFVEKIDALFRLPTMREKLTSDLREKIKSFFEFCHNPDFQIAFVGTIKTGKSTLINALLGRDYASMAVTPETAALTKFRSSDEDYVMVTFYNHGEWKQLWKSRADAESFDREYRELGADKLRDEWVGHEPYFKKVPNEDIEKELERWSSSKMPEHFFVKEIEVGISTLKGVPPQVVLVDTPGLSDPVAYRSEISRHYIRNADAVFVCIEAKKLEKEEIGTISSVFAFSGNKKDKVFVVGTHWDKLNEPDKDWAENKAFFIKQLTGTAFFDNETEARNNILHASAYLYNICRDYDDGIRDKARKLRQFYEDYCDRDVTDLAPLIPFIREKTNIAEIQKIIRNRLVQNYKNLFDAEIRNRYSSILHDTRRVIEDEKQDLSNILRDSASDEEIRRSLEQKVKDRENIQDAAEQLKMLMTRMTNQTEEIIRTVCSNIAQNAEEIRLRRDRRGRRKRKFFN